MENNTINRIRQLRPWGHLLALYEGQKEAQGYVVDYIETALDRHERCICFSDDEASKEGSFLGFRSLKRRETGQFLVLSPGRPLEKGEDEKAVVILHAMVEEALAAGYSGLALTGQVSWLIGDFQPTEVFFAGRKSLDTHIFASRPVSVFSCWDINQLKDQVFLEALSVHPLLVWDQTLYDNPYYLRGEPSSFSATLSPLKVWLKSLRQLSEEKRDLAQSVLAKKEEMDALHQRMTEGMMGAMIELLGMHDAYTNNHSESVSGLLAAFARHLDMPADQAAIYAYAGLVHDIGKTLVPRDLLNKRGPLTEDEFDQVKLHPLYGYKVLDHVESFGDLALIVRHHHERWDGDGYPDGRAGKDIPLAARLLAIVDAYDAMVHDRPYRRALSQAQALAEIDRCAGSQFDPQLAASFCGMMAGPDLQ